jgi:pyrimidine deaminase RibD-like protein
VKGKPKCPECGAAIFGYIRRTATNYVTLSPCGHDLTTNPNQPATRWTAERDEHRGENADG